MKLSRRRAIGLSTAAVMSGMAGGVVPGTLASVEARPSPIAVSTIRGVTTMYDAKEYLTGSWAGGCRAGQKLGRISVRSFNVSYVPSTGKSEAAIVTESCRGTMRFVASALGYAVHRNANNWIFRSPLNDRLGLSVATTEGGKDHVTAVFLKAGILEGPSKDVVKLGHVPLLAGTGYTSNGVFATVIGGDNALRKVSPGGEYNPPLLDSVDSSDREAVLSVARKFNIRVLSGDMGIPVSAG